MNKNGALTHATPRVNLKNAEGLSDATYTKCQKGQIYRDKKQKSD